MGVIKKKTAVRGTEGGIKYVCDVCSSDITSTVRIRCAHPACHEYDLCVTCFSDGKSSNAHNPATHSFQVIEQHSIPVFTEDWGADEELLLLEGAETYGLGSWADVADHIGGYRNKDEVSDHYVQTYIESSKFPLPERAAPEDKRLSDEVPREVFQARKKRRIEERKEQARTAPPATPKQKPTASVPACHEVQGYMPGRLEFETEYFNEAEEAVQHMQFEPVDGLAVQQAGPDSRTTDPELELKMTIMDIYNNKLTARVERKKVIFEHRLLEYRKAAAADKKRTKEEKELMLKAKPFARMMPHQDFDAFARGLEYELNLRQAIGQLQEWRRMGVGDLRAGEKYEAEKLQRAARGPAAGGPGAAGGPNGAGAGAGLDRLASIADAALPNGTDAAAAAAAAMANGSVTPAKRGASVARGGSAAPATTTPQPQPGLTNGQPGLKLSAEAAADLQLLTAEEREVCGALRLMPKAYLAMKEAVLREAVREGGRLKRKGVREAVRVEMGGRDRRLWEFWVGCGWVGRG
ncbi:hypothetical protein BDY21DRAFT_328761 [Lineolata rhizophorae]|uniref:Transcriptional adapter 2 n=1 Tax=Lineolata rhizophorae TaxID=578093 RepID=A0A6A6NN44_9PEZI|nr:hypothetical protein BDY21DRAFT_328761 [Lineolata rhizophorae]